ncbi:hypothetical protein CPB84DRAFT_1674382 [Gymnopilus junonius]|uniref:DUF6534 domain-containing protein n=1 Tax=Gymnopilus junonius TaxID=109634 RepID=A0A9P5TS72_GYMJU|nr:hypothetical protein CPB84DRAFT_1674382 [Gymnopilus junonius]
MSASATPPSVPLVVPRVDNTLGALLVGGLVAMALWGVTCVQMYNYFTRTNKDNVPAKTTVRPFLWVLDTFDSALNCHILYYYTVSNYLNPLALFHPVWSIIIHVAVTAISNFIIRTLFTIRVYRLSQGNHFLTGWIMAISLSDLEHDKFYLPCSFQIPTFPDLQKIAGLMYLTFGVGTGSDLSLALALSWFLYRSKTGFRSTDSLIKSLLIYSVNTGMIVAVDAALGLILYILMPNNLIFLGFYLLLSKLYVNAYLATLNARETMRTKKDDMLSINLTEIHSSRRFDVESTMPTFAEKGTESKTERMAISIQTLIDNRIDSDRIRPEQSLQENIPDEAG